MNLSVSLLERVRLPLVGLPQGGDRVATTGGAALAAAMRVIDRVHRDATRLRTLALPARAAGLAVVRVLVVGVGDRADRRHAGAVDEALLARVQAHDDVGAVATDDLRIGAGRARDLAALAGLHLDIVDDRAHRHLPHLLGAARLDVGGCAGHHAVADREALRREDVGLLAVLVSDERDEGRAVRIVFQPLDGRRHVLLAPLEVDQPVGALVPAASVARRDATRIVAPARLRQALGQRLDRPALVETGSGDDDELALGRRRRVEGFQCHDDVRSGL